MCPSSGLWGGSWIVIPSSPSWVLHHSTGPSFDALQACVYVFTIDEVTIAVPCYWWGHDRYLNVCPCWYQTDLGRHAWSWFRIRGGEGQCHETTPRLPRWWGVLNGEVGLHQPPSHIGNMPSAKIGRWGTQGRTHTQLRGLSSGRNDQGEKDATHCRQIGSEWDIQSPRGGIGEAGAHRPKSDKCTWRV